jgi:Zn-dependent protease with chaperone function
VTLWSRTALIAIAAIALAACETGRPAYEAPLRDAGVLKDDRATTDNKAESSGEQLSTNENYIGEDSFSYDGATFRIADLSPGVRPSLDSDEAGLWMMMDRFEGQLKTSGRLVGDAELSAYVRDVACRVAVDHCGNVRVFVVENPSFNASMAPNGTMLIHTGLLLRTRNEAELAAVLGHEIGHYLRRHSYQRMQSIIKQTNFMMFFQIALAVGGVPSPVGQASGLVVQGNIAAFSRDNEREADGYGSLLLHQVGYDPRVSANIWERITRENEAKDDDEQKPIFYASHPPTKERQQVLSELGAMLADKMPQVELGRDRFLAIVTPRRASWLLQETHLRQFKRSEALFDMMLEDGVNPAEIYYFKGELHRFRNDEEDAEKAVTLYETALEAEGTPPPEIYRSLGLLYRQQDKNAQAAGAFRDYLTHAPEAEDRLFIENLIGTLSTS